MPPSWESTLLEPKLAHKGVLRLEVEVKGKAAHASDPEAGVNAVVAMAPVIAALDRLAAEVRTRQERHTGRASLVISTIAGGVALNVIPASCVISIDRRVLPPETEDQAREEIVRTVTAALPTGLGAKAEVRGGAYSATEDASIVARDARRSCSEGLFGLGFTAFTITGGRWRHPRSPNSIAGPLGESVHIHR
jgi:acetylornithine deacetylase/succinyl-diaminopimelate desuccinylase-like protein